MLLITKTFLETFSYRSLTIMAYTAYPCSGLNHTFPIVNSVTLNETYSNIKSVYIGIPQGSILGPLLFIFYINDLHLSIKHSNIYHFADDTNLQLITNSLKKLNKYINQDMVLFNGFEQIKSH